MDPLTGSLIASGLSSGINAISTIGQNKANRKLTKEMFNMTNAYNTPLAQVERLKKAGLNPALMYQGSPQNTSQQPSAPKQDAVHIPETLLADVYAKIKGAQLAESKTIPQAININLGEGLVKKQEAETGNIIQQTETGKQMALKTATETAKIQQEYNLNKDLFNTNVSYRKAELDRLNTDVRKAKQELDYLPAEQKAKLEVLKNSALESMKRSRSLDNQDWIFQNEKELRELNINPSGNMIDTIIKYIVGGAIGTFKELFPTYN